MNLKQNKITVGELLAYPPAKEVFRRRFPMVLRQTLTGAALTVTLEQLLAFAGAYLPGKMISEVLRELEKV